MVPMKFLAKLTVLTLAFFLVCDSVGLAQGRRGRGFFRRPSNAAGLIRLDQVQKELKLTDEQKSRIDDIVDLYRNDRRQLYSGLRDLSREEREQKLEEVRSQFDQMATAAEKKIDGVLNDDQRQRLQQIVVQVLDARALTRAEVAEALTLNPEQKKKIDDVFESERQRQRDLFQQARDGKLEREEVFPKFRELRNEINTQALAVLTDEQKQQFEQMKGERFELERPERRGRRSRDDS